MDGQFTGTNYVNNQQNNANHAINNPPVGPNNNPQGMPSSMLYNQNQMMYSNRNMGQMAPVIPQNNAQNAQKGGMPQFANGTQPPMMNGGQQTYNKSMPNSQMPGFYPGMNGNLKMMYPNGANGFYNQPYPNMMNGMKPMPNGQNMAGNKDNQQLNANNNGQNIPLVGPNNPQQTAMPMPNGALPNVGVIAPNNGPQANLQPNTSNIATPLEQGATPLNEVKPETDELHTEEIVEDKLYEDGVDISRDTVKSVSDMGYNPKLASGSKTDSIPSTPIKRKSSLRTLTPMERLQSAKPSVSLIPKDENEEAEKDKNKSPVTPPVEPGVGMINMPNMNGQFMRPGMANPLGQTQPIPIQPYGGMTPMRMPMGAQFPMGMYPGMAMMPSNGNIPPNNGAPIPQSATGEVVEPKDENKESPTDSIASVNVIEPSNAEPNKTDVIIPQNIAQSEEVSVINLDDINGNKGSVEVKKKDDVVPIRLDEVEDTELDALPEEEIEETEEPEVSQDLAIPLLQPSEEKKEEIAAPLETQPESVSSPSIISPEPVLISDENITEEKEPEIVPEQAPVEEQLPETTSIVEPEIVPQVEAAPAPVEPTQPVETPVTPVTPVMPIETPAEPEPVTESTPEVVEPVAAAPTVEPEPAPEPKEPEVVPAPEVNEAEPVAEPIPEVVESAQEPTPTVEPEPVPEEPKAEEPTEAPVEEKVEEPVAEPVAEPTPTVEPEPVPEEPKVEEPTEAPAEEKVSEPVPEPEPEKEEDGPIIDDGPIIGDGPIIEDGPAIPGLESSHKSSAHTSAVGLPIPGPELGTKPLPEKKSNVSAVGLPIPGPELGTKPVTKNVSAVGLPIPGPELGTHEVKPKDEPMIPGPIKGNRFEEPIMGPQEEPANEFVTPVVKIPAGMGKNGEFARPVIVLPKPPKPAPAPMPEPEPIEEVEPVPQIEPVEEPAPVEPVVPEEEPIIDEPVIDEPVIPDGPVIPDEPVIPIPEPPKVVVPTPPKIAIPTPVVPEPPKPEVPEEPEVAPEPEVEPAVEEVKEKPIATPQTVKVVEPPKPVMVKVVTQQPKGVVKPVVIAVPKPIEEKHEEEVPEKEPTVIKPTTIIAPTPVVVPTPVVEPTPVEEPAPAEPEVAPEPVVEPEVAPEEPTPAVEIEPTVPETPESPEPVEEPIVPEEPVEPEPVIPEEEPVSVSEEPVPDIPENPTVFSEPFLPPETPEVPEEEPIIPDNPAVFSEPLITEDQPVEPEVVEEPVVEPVPVVPEEEPVPVEPPVEEPIVPEVPAVPAEEPAVSEEEKPVDDVVSAGLITAPTVKPASVVMPATSEPNVIPLNENTVKPEPAVVKKVVTQPKVVKVQGGTTVKKIVRSSKPVPQQTGTKIIKMQNGKMIRKNGDEESVDAVSNNGKIKITIPIINVELPEMSRKLFLAIISVVVILIGVLIGYIAFRTFGNINSNKIVISFYYDTDSRTYKFEKGDLSNKSTFKQKYICNSESCMAHGMNSVESDGDNGSSWALIYDDKPVLFNYITGSSNPNTGTLNRFTETEPLFVKDSNNVLVGVLFENIGDDGKKYIGACSFKSPNCQNLDGVKFYEQQAESGNKVYADHGHFVLLNANNTQDSVLFSFDDKKRVAASPRGVYSVITSKGKDYPAIILDVDRQKSISLGFFDGDDQFKNFGINGEYQAASRVLTMNTFSYRFNSNDSDYVYLTRELNVFYVCNLVEHNCVQSSEEGLSGGLVYSVINKPNNTGKTGDNYNMTDVFKIIRQNNKYLLKVPRSADSKKTKAAQYVDLDIPDEYNTSDLRVDTTVAPYPLGDRLLIEFVDGKVRRGVSIEIPLDQLDGEHDAKKINQKVTKHS